MAKIGLVLSGGGTRGLAHIGALKVLDKLGVKYDAIAGCSIGSIIGACLASGKSISEIEEFATNHKLKNFFNLSASKLGIKKAGLQQILHDFIGVKKFEDLKIPLYVNSTNLSTGKEVIFSEGNLLRAVKASAAIPGFFEPEVINKQYYVDGAVLNVSPFSILPADIQKYIMINVSPYNYLRPGKKINFVHVFETSTRLMQIKLMRAKLRDLPHGSYVLIEPDVGEHHSLENSKNFRNLIRKGEQAANAKRAEILELVR